MTSEAGVMSKPDSRGMELPAAAEANDDLPQGAFVHVDDAPPDDAALVNAQRVAEVQMVVKHGRQQVVGGGDDVEIAIEMEVDLLHRARPARSRRRCRRP